MGGISRFMCGTFFGAARRSRARRAVEVVGVADATPCVPCGRIAHRPASLEAHSVPARRRRVTGQIEASDVTGSIAMSLRGQPIALSRVLLGCCCAWLLLASAGPFDSSAAARDASALDTSFGLGGFLVRPESKVAAIAADGGVFSAAHGFAVTRFDGDGLPATSFGAAGTSPRLGVDADPSALAVATDDSVFVAGSDPQGDVLVAHLSSSGAQDMGFGIARIGSSNTMGAADFPTDRAPTGAVAMADGSVIVALPDSIIRLDRDGVPDASYGEAATARLASGTGPRDIYDIQDAGAGRVLVLANSGVATYTGAGVLVTRLGSDGHPDASFAASGSLLLSGIDFARATVRPDAATVLVSEDPCARTTTFPKSCRGEFIRRLDPRGHTLTKRRVPGANGGPLSAVTQDVADRLLIAQGSDRYAGDGNVVVRLDHNDRRDKHFGRCGAGAPRTGQPFSSEIIGVAPSGRIVQAGGSYSGGRFYNGQQGTVIAAQRGGEGAHQRVGRPTSVAGFDYKAGSLRSGLHLSYSSPVNAVVQAKIVDTLGRVVARGRMRVAACTTGRLRVRFRRRPHNEGILLHTTVRGLGLPRTDIEGGCIDKRGRVTTTEYNGPRKVYC